MHWFTTFWAALPGRYSWSHVSFVWHQLSFACLSSLPFWGAGPRTIPLAVQIWWRTFAFMSLGLDHVSPICSSVGIRLLGPGIGLMLYIWKGIAPAIWGSIGGAVLCGGYYKFVFVHAHDAMSVGWTFKKNIRGPCASRVEVHCDAEGRGIGN